MRISRFAALLLACVLLVLPAAGLAASTSLSVAIVADDHLALRPLELNHRDVVSLLNLVYEGLFEIDDNYQPQPKLAYAYSFSNDGRKVQVTLRDDISFHNGQTLTSADVVATLITCSSWPVSMRSSIPRCPSPTAACITRPSIPSSRGRRRTSKPSSSPCAAPATARSTR